MATGGEIEDEANTLINMLEKCSIGTGKFKKKNFRSPKRNFLSPTLYHLFFYLSILTVLTVKTFTFFTFPVAQTVTQPISTISWYHLVKGL